MLENCRMLEVMYYQKINPRFLMSDKQGNMIYSCLSVCRLTWYVTPFNFPKLLNVVKVFKTAFWV